MGSFWRDESSWSPCSILRVNGSLVCLSKKQLLCERFDGAFVAWKITDVSAWGIAPSLMTFNAIMDGCVRNEEMSKATKLKFLCWKKLNIEQLIFASTFSDCELEICFRQKCQSPGFFLFRYSVVLRMPVTQRTKVADLVQEMSKYDLMPNLITYSTMIKVQICRECESVICWSWCKDAMYRGIYSYF